MNLIIHIFLTSIVPILLLIGGGFFIDKKFNLDLRTLSKLNFYILLPAFIFQSLYTAPLNHESFEIALCAFVIMFSNSGLVSFLNLFLHYDKMKVQIIRNSTMFNNGGNIGVAIATFVFSNMPYVVNGTTPYVQLGIVAVVSTFVIQTIGCNTLGFYQAGVGRLTRRDALSLIFHMPIVYAVIASLLFKLAPFDLTKFIIWPPVHYYAAAFVGLSMITLGTQLSRSSLNFFKKDVMIGTALRLLAGPALAALIVIIFIHVYGPLNPIAAQAIVITYSVPSAVNTALMAFEMKNNPEFATQIVMATTILSAITMPLAIIFAYYLFPI
ncbi:MAG: AEC family transporter [Veillonellaceae bacterium]|nr:AEC family transporter [Veillonellaceae bacterium]